jgi:hypothetical protein
MGFGMNRLLDFTRAKESQAAMEIRIISLEDENAKLQSQIGDLQADNTELQTQLRPYIDRDLLRDGLQRHDQTNTLVDPTTGTHYCIPCLETTPPIKMSLSRSATGFRCPSCKTQFTNTSMPRPSLSDMEARALNR